MACATTTSFGETEDYDLWTRVLEHRRGGLRSRPARPLSDPSAAGLAAPCELQRALAARSRCGRSPRRARPLPSRGELAWRGLARRAARADVDEARRCLRRARGRVRALGALLRRRARGRPRVAAARSCGAPGPPRAACGAPPAARPSRLDPLLRRTSPPAAGARGGRGARVRDADLLRALAADARRAADPRRRRLPRADAVPRAAPRPGRGAPEIDLTVLYAAGTVAGRTWRVEPKHRAVFLRGMRVPGAGARAPPRLPAHARCRLALNDAPGRRRRLGLEHVRGPGRDRLVPPTGRPVRPRRREPRRGPRPGGGAP